MGIAFPGFEIVLCEAVDERFADGGVVGLGGFADVEFFFLTEDVFHVEGKVLSNLGVSPDPFAGVEDLAAHGHAVGRDAFDDHDGAAFAVVAEKRDDFQVGDFVKGDGEGVLPHHAVCRLRGAGIDGEDHHGDHSTSLTLLTMV